MVTIMYTPEEAWYELHIKNIPTTDITPNIFLLSQKINGMMETNILKVIKGLSNLKLNGSKNHGLIPIIVETHAVMKEIFLLGYKTNNKIKLAKVKKQADRIFEVKPSSVR